MKILNDDNEKRAHAGSKCSVPSIGSMLLL